MGSTSSRASWYQPDCCLSCLWTGIDDDDDDETRLRLLHESQPQYLYEYVQCYDTFTESQLVDKQNDATIDTQLEKVVSIDDELLDVCLESQLVDKQNDDTNDTNDTNDTDDTNETNETNESNNTIVCAQECKAYTANGHSRLRKMILENGGHTFHLVPDDSFI